MRAMRVGFVLFAAALALAGCQKRGADAVDSKRIIAADQHPGDWMSYGRTYGEQRFSPLKEIDASNVTVTSAAPLDDGQRKTLSTALERKLKRSIRMQCHTDPALIGGAVLQAGDLVIDGSLRTQLNKITYELTA